jgi:chromosomal replication initiator protein
MRADNELKTFWQTVLTKIKAQLSPMTFETWFSVTELIEFEDDYLVIHVPDPFVKEWLESKHFNLIKTTVQNEIERPVEISIIVDIVEKENSAVQNSKPFVLNPKYTFDTFVIGGGNRFAHAAALAVAESAKSYNPLFIYGGSGLGKTHLMHAVAHKIQQGKSSSQVVYVTGEQFTNELIDSIRYEKTIEFRNTYRQVDILLIDDIQFIAGKDSTQEEFFHTFNTLYSANKQIVISSDRSPREIPTLEERLRSRFEWGLTTDIQPPDYETRMAILKKKAQSENFTAPDEVIHFIATSIHTNIRQLEGALIRYIAYLNIHPDMEMTVAKVQELLKDMLPQNRKIVSLDTIVHHVAKRYSIDPSQLKKKSRVQSILLPRHIAMYLCRELSDLTLEQIGKEFDGQHHTTVMHACDKITQQKEKDPLLEKMLTELEEDIKAH